MEASAGGAKPKGAMASNVEVDESPLHNQMQKNKECKWLHDDVLLLSRFQYLVSASK